MVDLILKLEELLIRSCSLYKLDRGCCRSGVADCAALYKWNYCVFHLPRGGRTDQATMLEAGSGRSPRSTKMAELR